MGYGNPSFLEIERYNKRHGRPWQKPIQCKTCRKISPEVSNNGYCPTCGMNKCKRVALEIKDRKGVFFQRHRKGLKEYISGG